MLTPTLVLNPRDDSAFVTLAQRLVADGARSADALQAGLRNAYPEALVRPRQLSAELDAVWYVYRDGSWTPTRAAPRSDA